MGVWFKCRGYHCCSLLASIHGSWGSGVLMRGFAHGGGFGKHGRLGPRWVRAGILGRGREPRGVALCDIEVLGRPISMRQAAWRRGGICRMNVCRPGGLWTATLAPVDPLPENS